MTYLLGKEQKFMTFGDDELDEALGKIRPSTSIRNMQLSSNKNLTSTECQQQTLGKVKTKIF